jgi:hypothetical protein
MYVRTYPGTRIVVMCALLRSESCEQPGHSTTVHGYVRSTMVHMSKWYQMVRVSVPSGMDHTYCNTIMLFHNFLIGKGTHVCTENHMCFGRIHGSHLREGANAGQHTPTLSLPLPQWRGLPRESPLQCLRACRLGYEPEYKRTYAYAMSRPGCRVRYHGTGRYHWHHVYQCTS